MAESDIVYLDTPIKLCVAKNIWSKPPLRSRSTTVNTLAYRAIITTPTMLPIKRVVFLSIASSRAAGKR